MLERAALFRIAFDRHLDIFFCVCSDWSDKTFADCDNRVVLLFWTFDRLVKLDDIFVCDKTRFIRLLDGVYCSAAAHVIDINFCSHFA